uniref:CUB domain-containing protein n=1 Tax=Macrostomum lignano TaxID=282301 RepID=A0A1I8F443_9PLAT
MTTAASACGGYREGLNTGQSNYDRNQRCIWLFAAKNGTGFRINVTSVSLEGTGNNSTGCRDYLQITDGSSVATELAYLCQRDVGCVGLAWHPRPDAFNRMFIICAIVEMPERKGPSACDGESNQSWGLLGRCGAKNKGGSRFGRVHHHSKAGSRADVSRRSSVSVGKRLGSRLFGVRANLVRNTLSPRIYSAPRPAASPDVTAAANCHTPAPADGAETAGPVTLAVPKVSST